VSTPTPGPGTAGPARRTGTPGRYQRSATGMVGAMVVLLLVIAGFWLLRETFRTTPEGAVRSVDYARTAEYARAQASFDVLAPTTLPPEWRATSTSYLPPPGERWHLGLLTGSQEYVGLEQARHSVASMVEEYVDPEATREGTVRVGGATWRVYADEGGDRALVRREGELTTLVVGTVEQDALVDFTAGLR